MLFNEKTKRDLSQNNIFSSAISCYLFPFIIFGGYLIYCIIGKLIPNASGYYLIQYLYTYDRGYISRGFIGEVISKFTDTVTDDITRMVITIFSVLLMIAMSVCIGKALSKVRLDKERFTFVLFVVVMVFVIPMPYAFYYTDMKLDKLVWALTLFSVYLADNRIGKWLVPFICALATVVNPIFVFTSMILIAIILLQEFHSNGMLKKDGILCGVTYLVIIALALLAPISEKWVEFSNAGEMVEYFFSRYAGELKESDYDSFVNLWLIDFFLPSEKILETTTALFFRNWGMGIKTILHLIFIALPAYAFLGTFWVKAIRKEENKFQKFIYFLCAISPIVIIPPLVLSWEFNKLFCNNILVQAGLIVFFTVKNNPAVTGVCKDIKEWGKKHLAAAVAAVVYFVSFFAVIFN